MTPAEMEVGDDPTILYRLYAADGALLYIGIAISARRRFRQHLKEHSWWRKVARKTAVLYATGAKAKAAETAAIKSEKPRYNIQGTPVNAAALAAARRGEADWLFSGEPVLFGGESKTVRDHYRRLIEARQYLDELQDS